MLISGATGGSPAVTADKFKFVNQKWNWQQAAIINLTLHVVVVNMLKTGSMTIPFVLYFGMPQQRGSGKYTVSFPNWMASDLAASAVNQAFVDVVDSWINNQALTEGDLQGLWIKDMQFYFGASGGTISRIPAKGSMSPIVDGSSKF